MTKCVQTKKLLIQIKNDTGKQTIVPNQPARLKDPDNHMRSIPTAQGDQNQCSASIVNNNARVTAGELSSNNKSLILNEQESSSRNIIAPRKLHFMSPTP